MAYKLLQESGDVVLAETGDNLCLDAPPIGTVSFVGEGAFASPTLTVPGTDVDIWIVAGGGGGGKAEPGQWGDGGGGGGAGGYKHIVDTKIDGIYHVVVGTGGLGSTLQTAKGQNGLSSFFGVFEAHGGGGGGSDNGDAIYNGGVAGGSGGGAANDYYNAFYGGGASPAGEGFAGGDAVANTTSWRAGSGGGGAASPGIARTGNTGGAGGTGVVVVGTTRAVGGKGGDYVSAVNVNGDSGAVNTGNGGGGAPNNGGNGGNGGSGVVIIRYAVTSGLWASGGTITTAGGYTYHTFTASGDFVLVTGSNLGPVSFVGEGVVVGPALTTASLSPSLPTNPQGCQRFWLDGLPFTDLYVALDGGTQQVWAAGKPEFALFVGLPYWDDTPAPTGQTTGALKYWLNGIPFEFLQRGTERNEGTNSYWVSGLPTVGLFLAAAGVNLGTVSFVGEGAFVGPLTTAILMATSQRGELQWALPDLYINPFVPLVDLLNGELQWTPPVLRTRVTMAAALRGEGVFTPATILTGIALVAAFQGELQYATVPALLMAREWSYSFDWSGLESEAVNSASDATVLSYVHGRRSVVSASRYAGGRGYAIRGPQSLMGVSVSLPNRHRVSGWERFYLRVNSLPTGDDLVIWSAASNQGCTDPDVRLTLSSTGYLKAWDSWWLNQPYLGIAPTQLTVGEWYRVDIDHRWRGLSDGEFRLSLDGNEEIVATNRTSGFLGTQDALWLSSQLGQPYGTLVASDGSVDIDDWVSGPVRDRVPTGRLYVLPVVEQGTYDEWTDGVNSWKTVARAPDSGVVQPDTSRRTHVAGARTSYYVDPSVITGAVRAIKFVADGDLLDCWFMLIVNGVETLHYATADINGSTASAYYIEPPLTRADIVEIGVKKDSGTTQHTLRGLWLLVDVAEADVAEEVPTADTQVSCTSYVGTGMIKDVPLTFRPSMLWIFGSNGVRYFWHDQLASIDGALLGRGGFVPLVTRILSTGFTVTGDVGSANETGVTFSVLAICDPTGDLVRRGSTAFGSDAAGQTVPIPGSAFTPEFLMLIGDRDLR